jgi:transposase-like protein
VERVREPGGVRHKALVIAYGVHQSGRREVIGLDVGEAETEAFWREFLRGLRARGLQGVRLGVSDAHQGLKTAILIYTTPCDLTCAARGIRTPTARSVGQCSASTGCR